MALQPSSYIVEHLRCACGYGCFTEWLVVVPSCPQCGKQTWQRYEWNLSLSAIPALSAVAKVHL